MIRVKETEKRLRRLEEQLPKEPDMIKDVVMLEDGRFMCTPYPSYPCEGVTFELPMLVPPGSPLEEYCREVYQRENIETEKDKT
jgi:hypothetical protein